MQKHFVHELGIAEEEAFLQYNLAPICLRRDVGVLGFLHKRVLGECHPGIARLFPMCGEIRPRHNKQIESRLYECVSRPVLFNRSIFGMVHIYNRLPQFFVDLENVSKFQHELTNVAREACATGVATWKDCIRLSGLRT